MKQLLAKLFIPILIITFLSCATWEHMIEQRDIGRAMRRSAMESYAEHGRFTGIRLASPSDIAEAKRYRHYVRSRKRYDRAYKRMNVRDRARLQRRRGRTMDYYEWSGTPRPGPSTSGTWYSFRSKRPEKKVEPKKRNKPTKLTKKQKREKRESRNRWSAALERWQQKKRKDRAEYMSCEKRLEWFRVNPRPSRDTFNKKSGLKSKTLKLTPKQSQRWKEQVAKKCRVIKERRRKRYISRLTPAQLRALKKWQAKRKEWEQKRYSEDLPFKTQAYVEAWHRQNPSPPKPEFRIKVIWTYQRSSK